AGHAVAYERFDDAIVDATDGVIARVRDVDGAVRPDHHVVRQAEGCATQERSIVEAVLADLRAVERLLPVGAGDRAEVAGERINRDGAARTTNAADDIVAVFADVDRAVRGDNDAIRIREGRRIRGVCRILVALKARARNRADLAVA